MQLILCGGGSGEQNTLANQKLNEIIDHVRPLLYVPLAMDEDEYPYDSCYEWIQGELSNVDIPSIEMVRTFEELASKKLQSYTAIFIGGGNTYKLLSGLKQSGAFDNIKNYINNDGIVIGGSAGAVIFGYDIDIIESMDPNNVELKDTKGFDVLQGVSIFPHYTNKKSKLTEQENEVRLNKFTTSIVKFSKSVGEVIAIPEEDAIYINDDKVEILGTRPYYTFKNEISQKYEIENNYNTKKISNKIKKELLCIKNIKKVEIVKNIAKITYLKKIDEANVIDTINKLGYFTKKDYMSQDIKDIDSDMKLKKFIFILVSILLLIFHKLNRQLVYFDKPLV